MAWIMCSHKGRLAEQLLDANNKWQSTVFFARHCQQIRLTCIIHACMQHIGHVDGRAAKTAHARGGCVSRQIIHISGIRPFI